MNPLRRAIFEEYKALGMNKEIRVRSKYKGRERAKRGLNQIQ